MADPVFLTLAEVIEVHRDQIQRYGGQTGVRDFGKQGTVLYFMNGNQENRPHFSKDAMLAIASGKMAKIEFATLLRALPFTRGK